MTSDVRHHSSDDMLGLGELDGVMEPVAVVLRPDGSVDAYGYVAVVDQRPTLGMVKAILDALLRTNPVDLAEAGQGPMEPACRFCDGHDWPGDWPMLAPPVRHRTSRGGSSNFRHTKWCPWLLAHDLRAAS